MLRKLWRTLEVLLMLLGLVAIPVIALQIQDQASRRAAEPPLAVSTLEQFRQWRPQYANAFRFDARGSAYYLVHGERSRALASGPSGYVFDERGNLVGWILDTGDDSFIRVTKDETARKSLSVSAIPAAR